MITSHILKKLNDLGFITEKAKKRNNYWRCPTISKPNASEAGWYIVNDDFVSYGSWRDDIESGYFFLNEIKPFTEEEKRQYAKQRAEYIRRNKEIQERQKQERRNDVDKYTREVLPKIATGADTHSYLIKKQARKRWDMSIDTHDNLIIPVYSHVGEVVGYQIINGDHVKKFKSGTSQDGTFYALREPGVPIYEAEWAILVEGFATGDAIEQIIEEYTDSRFFVVFVAFSAGNLPKVARHLDRLMANAVRLVIADNDEAGIKAAKETGWNWFTMCKQEDENKKGFDANDCLLTHGINKSVELFHQKLLNLSNTP